MSDKGIIFSAPMVRALLAGRKTQTRRLLNPQPRVFEINEAGTPCQVGCMQVEGEAVNRVWLGSEQHGVLTGQQIRYARGDRLYVREAWTVRGRYTDVVEVGYRASQSESHTEYVEQWPVEKAVPGKGKWPTWPKYGPSIHMPRWASRLWLAVTDVRVQRLQDISEADAIAEGIHRFDDGWHYEPNPEPAYMRLVGIDPVKLYSRLWDDLHDKPGATWADNPWIVAVSFDVNKGNIDGE